METSGNTSIAAQALRAHGFALVRKAGAKGLVELIETLGNVLKVEEVVVDSMSPSLVKSNLGLSLHTDHHRADAIVWHCIAQSDHGGESVLADGLAAFATLAEEHQSALANIQLQEHSVFTGDRDQHPVISFRDGRPRLYYSYWLVDPALGGALREAFEAFDAAVRSAEQLRVRLEPGDVLAIDNGRMLHGRTEIGGSQRRHLRRYWIETASS